MPPFRLITADEMDFSPFNQLSVSALAAPRLTLKQHGIKRVFDVAVASVALLLLWPLMLVAAFLVRMDNRDSIIFTQERVGKNGEAFTIYKFRTMITPATPEGQMQHTSPVDPTITKIGRFLRNTSIDELPQLLNVLKGDMSIVGPRPQAVYHADFYNRAITHYHLRHQVKPGITGAVQVSPMRNETKNLSDIKARLEMDLGSANQSSY